MIALGQLQTARLTQEHLRKVKHVNWSLRKCFFVNMGEFHVHPTDWKTPSGRTSSAVDASQMLALVDKGLLNLPNISEEEINDRNKADTLARMITIVQVV